MRNLKAVAVFGFDVLLIIPGVGCYHSQQPAHRVDEVNNKLVLMIPNDEAARRFFGSVQEISSVHPGYAALQRRLNELSPHSLIMLETNGEDEAQYSYTYYCAAELPDLSVILLSNYMRGTGRDAVMRESRVDSRDYSEMRDILSGCTEAFRASLNVDTQTQPIDDGEAYSLSWRDRNQKGGSILLYQCFVGGMDDAPEAVGVPAVDEVIMCVNEVVRRLYSAHAMPDR